MMEHRKIIGRNAFADYSRTRTACRGIVIRNGDVLLSYETKTDLWMLPGGGIEGAESPEECCVREICEETGYLTDPYECFLQMDEFYEEWKFTSYFFLCRVTGTGERKPTPRELRVGMEPRWVPFEEAAAIFSHHADFDGVYEEKRGIYQREFEALTICRERLGIK